MESKQETQIPCVTCKSYHAKLRKFSCKPHDCKELSSWLLQHVPQLRPDRVEMGVQLPETSIPYVV
ncbi:MAG: hypothetical protein ABSG33_07615 [Candidatus Bathyarchaeia archaeon]